MTVHLSKFEIERPLNPTYYYGLFNIFFRESHQLELNPRFLIQPSKLYQLS